FRAPRTGRSSLPIGREDLQWLLHVIRCADCCADQSERLWPLRPLGFYPDLGGEPRRHPPHGHRLRVGDRSAVPTAEGARPMSLDTSTHNDASSSEDSRQWTARVRNAATTAFPPD